MKLVEVASILPHLWISVPRGTIWQKEINALWVFKTFEMAQLVSWSKEARQLMADRYTSSTLVPVTSANGVNALVAINSGAARDLGYAPESVGAVGLPILAISVNEKSARALGRKAFENIGAADPWVYKTWNSDTDDFKRKE